MCMWMSTCQKKKSLVDGANHAHRPSFLWLYVNRHLLTDPKQRKVIVCESPLAPIALKQTIAKVLFEKLQVRETMVAPPGSTFFLYCGY